ncbi:DNA-protecting protein DprA [Duganella sp. BJB488]|nr:MULTISPECIES: DNA-processing protein DprA [unclassified Duganella]RFP22764.1 DNA-protecting protein DprA [Duganella sp. BJB489]RFP25162.1 DNA-protecting protein DprA [Duganella sp. BJB488]RFP33762.1 DNA-protecting protein DprA [Duganella sp. BJB480]
MSRAVQATDTPNTPSQPVSAAALAGWLRLQMTDGVGLVSAHRLLERFATPEAVFGAGRAALLDEVKPEQADALLRAPPAELAALVDATMAWQQQPGNLLLSYGHPDYPEALRQIAAAPLLLYIKGRAELLERPSLAVVGARNASAQGVLNAERMAQALSEAGLTIVSGLALGIDAAAHTGGLNGPGSTVAVVGTGADRIYPARNKALARRIAEEGCIVSEYALGTPPLRDNFPRRNRVISGLASGVLVVEAAAKSGSLITAKLAGEQGKELYAIPGSIHATLAKGCHKLIREDGAKLVESAADILTDLGRLTPGAPGCRPLLDDTFVDRVLAALGEHPAAPDLLALRLNQSAAELQGQLLALELAGLVERLPGGMFQRLRG